MMSVVNPRHRVRCGDGLRPRVRNVCRALNNIQQQFHLLMWRNQNGHAKLAMSLCLALEFDSHCFKLLSPLQGTKQLKLSQDTWLYYSLSSEGASFVDDIQWDAFSWEQIQPCTRAGSHQLARASC